MSSRWRIAIDLDSSLNVSSGALLVVSRRKISSIGLPLILLLVSIRFNAAELYMVIMPCSSVLIMASVILFIKVRTLPFSTFSRSRLSFNLLLTTF